MAYPFKKLREFTPIVKLWALRCLITLGAHEQFLRERGFSSEDLARSLGIAAGEDGVDFDAKQALAKLRVQHKAIEAAIGARHHYGVLRRNVDKLGDMVGLSEIDRVILEFATVVHSNRLLGEATRYLGELTTSRLVRVLAALLGLDDPDVAMSIAPRGILAQSGLLTIDGQLNDMPRKLDLLSRNFADSMCTDEVNLIDLLREKVVPATPATLTLNDYQHIEADLRYLRPFLQEALLTRRQGVNIFIHGAPGTGKSELVKALAQEFETELFEITSEDEDGDPIDGEERLRAFRAAQSFFARQRMLLLFDEVEDVFNDGCALFGQKSTAQKRKAWVNRMLESNPVPAIWLSNQARGMDSAFLRRFDMTFELPIPPKAKRAQIIQAACGNLLDEQTANRLAESEKLAPAVVTRAASVVKSIQQVLGEQGASEAMAHLVGNTMQAQGHHVPPKHDPNRLPEVYDPTFVNTETDLRKLAAGLARARAGRLCLYGPAGTGKTAFGRWLAEQLDMPLHVTRASDLLSKWVGESEQNIARAFRVAEKENAILLIDEVDSFLQDRRGARQSWEVTRVNEMLTQMESFTGIFIASTNLMDNLDQAALRRFDLKVRFNYLQSDQAAALFASCCQQLSLPLSMRAEKHVRRLEVLTPGDFSAVIRQSRFRPFETADDFAEGLRKECTLKTGGVQSNIGFV